MSEHVQGESSLADRIVKPHYENINSGLSSDRERGLQIYHPDVRTYDPLGDMIGLDAFLERMRMWDRAFPGGDEVLTRSVESGDLLMVEGYYTGTHSGPGFVMPFGEVAATGRVVRFDFADHFVVQDGLVVEHRIFYDVYTMLDQLGLLPSTAPSARAAPAIRDLSQRR